LELFRVWGGPHRMLARPGLSKTCFALIPFEVAFGISFGS